MKRWLCIIGIPALAALIRLFQSYAFQDFFGGYADPKLNIWPGTVIFGFYFAILFFALRSICGWNRQSPVKGLGLIAVVGITGDLVLVNISEAKARLYVEHGFVVLWDITFLFLLWTLYERFSADDEVDLTSSVVFAFPAMKVGRELLTMGCFVNFRPSTVDFYFGDIGLLVTWSLFLFYVDSNPTQWRQGRWGRSLEWLVVVFTGYWVLQLLENTSKLALGGNPWQTSPWLNVICCVISAIGGGIFYRYWWSDRISLS